MFHDTSSLQPGMAGTYVDDSLNAGSQIFEKQTEQKLETFDSKTKAYSLFNYFGAQEQTLSPSNFSVSQKYYASSMIYLHGHAILAEFRQHRALLSSMCHTRLDLACYANRAAQRTERTLSKEKISELNLAIKIVKENASSTCVFLCKIWTLRMNAYKLTLRSRVMKISRLNWFLFFLGRQQ